MLLESSESEQRGECRKCGGQIMTTSDWACLANHVHSFTSPSELREFLQTPEVRHKSKRSI